MTSLLEFDSKHIDFSSSVGNNVNIFFDDHTQVLFTIQATATDDHIVATGRGCETRFEFTIKRCEDAESEGGIQCIKLSPDHRITAVQKGPYLVAFVNLAPSSHASGSSAKGSSAKGSPSAEYTHSYKGKNTRIAGLEWITSTEIVFLTNKGLELYQVFPEKMSLKALKSHNVSLNWYVYSVDSKLLLASSGVLGNIMNPFLIRGGGHGITRLAKFDVELYANPQPARLMLLDRDITLADIYGEHCVLVLRHNPRPHSSGAEILVYTLSKDPSVAPTKTRVLKLGSIGRFALHVIDNLVVVHQQADRNSVIFDFCLNAGQSEGTYILHAPLLQSQLIQPCSTAVLGQPELDADMYSVNWVMFQPNVVVDARKGVVWFLRLNLQSAPQLIKHRMSLIAMLLHRKQAKFLLLQVLKNACECEEQARLSLVEAGSIFERLNDVYRSYLSTSSQQSGMPESTTHDNCIVLDQSDVYSQVVFPLVESETVPKAFVANLVIEYIISLQARNIVTQPFFHEILVQCLVRSDQHQRLLQFIQYHILPDSKPLAFLLLSLTARFPPAAQLALDMLFRLGIGGEEIVEILLSQNKPLQAMRYLIVTGVVDSIEPLKLVEAAWNSGDKLIFYAIFRYFEQRQWKLKGNSQFAKGDNFDRYQHAFLKLVKTGSFSATPEDPMEIT